MNQDYAPEKSANPPEETFSIGIMIGSNIEFGTPRETRQEFFSNCMAELESVLPEVEFQIGKIHQSETTRQDIESRINKQVSIVKLLFPNAEITTPEKDALPAGYSHHRTEVTARLNRDQLTRLNAHFLRTHSQIAEELVEEIAQQQTENYIQHRTEAKGLLESIKEESKSLISRTTTSLLMLSGVGIVLAPIYALDLSTFASSILNNTYTTGSLAAGSFITACHLAVFGILGWGVKSALDHRRLAQQDVREIEKLQEEM